MKKRTVDEKYVQESLTEYYSTSYTDEPTIPHKICESDGLRFHVSNLTSEEFKKKMNSSDFEDFRWECSPE